MLHFVQVEAYICSSTVVDSTTFQKSLTKCSALVVIFSFWRKEVWPRFFLFPFYLEGEKATVRSVGPPLRTAASCLIFSPHREGWVCLKIHCCKGELKGGMDHGWGLPQRHSHLRLRCFKSSFKEREIQTLSSGGLNQQPSASQPSTLPELPLVLHLL